MRFFISFFSLFIKAVIFLVKDLIQNYTRKNVPHFPSNIFHGDKLSLNTRKMNFGDVLKFQHRKARKRSDHYAFITIDNLKLVPIQLRHHLHYQFLYIL